MKRPLVNVKIKNNNGNGMPYIYAILYSHFFVLRAACVCIYKLMCCCCRHRRMVCSEHGNGVRVREKGTQRIYRQRSWHRRGASERCLLMKTKLCPRKSSVFGILCARRVSRMWKRNKTNQRRNGSRRFLVLENKDREADKMMAFYRLYSSQRSLSLSSTHTLPVPYGFHVKLFHEIYFIKFKFCFSLCMCHGAGVLQPGTATIHLETISGASVCVSANCSSAKVQMCEVWKAKSQFKQWNAKFYPRARVQASPVLIRLFGAVFSASTMLWVAPCDDMCA